MIVKHKLGESECDLDDGPEVVELKLARHASGCNIEHVRQALSSQRSIVRRDSSVVQEGCLFSSKYSISVRLMLLSLLPIV